MTSSFKSGYIASSNLELSNMGTENRISSTSCPCAQLEFLQDDPLQRILILLLSVRTRKYPPVEPEALRCARSKHWYVRCSCLLPFWVLRTRTIVLNISIPQRQFGRFSSPQCICVTVQHSKTEDRGILPEMSDFYCHPGRAGGSPIWFRTYMRLSGQDSLFQLKDEPEEAKIRRTREGSFGFSLAGVVGVGIASALGERAYLIWL